jgi:hypothetical protein
MNEDDVGYIDLARVLLDMCRESDLHPSTQARSLSLALAVTIQNSNNPGTLLALTVRDLSEAAIRNARAARAKRRPRKVKTKAIVVDLATARRRYRATSEGEPA